jgi:hypothetical protein
MQSGFEGILEAVCGFGLDATIGGEGRKPTLEAVAATASEARTSNVVGHCALQIALYNH